MLAHLKTAALVFLCGSLIQQLLDDRCRGSGLVAFLQLLPHRCSKMLLPSKGYLSRFLCCVFQYLFCIWVEQSTRSVLSRWSYWRWSFTMVPRQVRQPTRSVPPSHHLPLPSHSHKVSSFFPLRILFNFPIISSPWWKPSHSHKVSRILLNMRLTTSIITNTLIIMRLVTVHVDNFSSHHRLNHHIWMNIIVHCSGQLSSPHRSTCTDGPLEEYSE